MDAVDRADGKPDGKWRDNEIEELLKGSTHPRARRTSSASSRRSSRREASVPDDVADLLFLNFKEIDFVSHVWSMNSPEMEDAVVAQDEALKRFVSFLNRQVGKGEWAMALTADHASMPDPAASGGLPDLDRPDAGR